MHNLLCFTLVICGLSAAAFGDKTLVITEEFKHALVDHHNKVRSEVRDVSVVTNEKIIPEMSVL